MATTTRTRRPAAKTATRKPTAKQAAAAEAKKAERAALVASLEALVQDFEYDEEDRAMVRAFESLTTHYSEGNALLIMAQCAAQGRRIRGLNDVGGFNAFMERGRSVKAGEHKSIYIWARAAKKAEDTTTAATPETQTAAATDEKEKSFYFPVGIFHISQTEDKAKADARRAAAKATA